MKKLGYMVCAPINMTKIKLGIIYPRLSNECKFLIFVHSIYLSYHRLSNRQVAAATEVDTSMISKFKKGERFPTREQVEKLALLFHLPEKQLLVHAFSDKLIADLSNEPLAQEILEQSIKKLKTKNKE